MRRDRRTAGVVEGRLRVASPVVSQHDGLWSSHATPCRGHHDQHSGGRAAAATGRVIVATADVALRTPMQCISRRRPQRTVAAPRVALRVRIKELFLDQSGVALRGHCTAVDGAPFNAAPRSPRPALGWSGGSSDAAHWGRSRRRRVGFGYAYRSAVQPQNHFGAWHAPKSAS